ncbi:MAG: multiprotein-bridging factor 1 family protein [Candidatus Binatia bacterium]
MKIPSAKLRELRRRRGWTQRDLAEQLDVDPMSVSRWERGLSQPRRAMHDRLWALFDEMPTTTAAQRHRVAPSLGLRVLASERIDELVRAVGLDPALRALREIALLARKPPSVRFADEPTKRMREVEDALREQSALIAHTKIQ